MRILLAGICAVGICATATTAGSANAATAATVNANAPAKQAKDKKAKPYCARHKCIALTFDDGPWPYTPELLDTLKKHKAKATFFVVGRKVANRPELTRRIAKEGHEIGNHTWNHPNLTELSDEDILEEVRSTSEVIKETIGTAPTLMRPPFGATNARVGELMAELGLPQIKWSGSTLDWQARNTKVIASRTLKLAERNGVILLHDIVPETVKAMPKVLSTLRKQGYRFVTVSTLFEGQKLKAGEIYPRKKSKKK